MASNAQKIKLIVYINFMILAWATVYVVYRMTKLIINDKETTQNLNPEETKAMQGLLSAVVRQTVVYVIVAWTLVVVYTTVINVILLKGLNQRSHSKCLFWLVLAGIGTIYQINRVVQSFISDDYFEGIYLLIWALVSLFSLITVFNFMNEIKSDSTLQPLTSKP